MPSSSFRLIARHGAVLPGLLAIGQQWSRKSAVLCEESPNPLNIPEASATTDSPPSPSSTTPIEEELFHNLFPKRQLHTPKKEYPLWDDNWDGKKPEPLEDPREERRRYREIRKRGITRHIILVRHGQYDETSSEDEKRILTPLGRQQADKTGQRIAEMIQGAEDSFGPCRVKVVRVSNMTRAKETADIIAQHLPNVERAEPDPLLNERKPCHTIPGGKASANAIAKVDEGNKACEEAFQKYFARADYEEYEGEKPTDELHEYEIIVCHANVVRYFFCRALQLPPEAWLRLCTFNCSLTYLTIRPTGSVSCRMLGDIGHLPYNMSTFSMHHGYNW